MSEYDIVIPTIGRPSLAALLASLHDAGARPGRVVLVDDRPAGGPPLGTRSGLPLRTVRSGGLGPAAARNEGALHTTAPWIVFLDDDVVVEPGWHEALVADLAGAEDDVAARQARISVPLPDDRPPTDWERNTARLATGRWITADVAVRRDAFVAAGGFDARFRRAYREDSDLALRLEAAGWRLVPGERRTVHPVRPGRFLESLRQQRGNADDVLMAAKHGPDYRRSLGEAPSRVPSYAATVALGAAAAVALARRRPTLALLAGCWWAVRTARFAWHRLAPGPRDGAEVVRMVVTSVLIPPAAVVHHVRGRLHHGGARG